MYYKSFACILFCAFLCCYIFYFHQHFSLLIFSYARNKKTMYFALNILLFCSISNLPAIVLSISERAFCVIYLLNLQVFTTISICTIFYCLFRCLFHLHVLFILLSKVSLPLLRCTLPFLSHFFACSDTMIKSNRNPLHSTHSFYRLRRPPNRLKVMNLVIRLSRQRSSSSVKLKFRRIIPTRTKVQ